MRKVLIALILTIVGFTAIANGFKYQDNYSGKITEGQVEELIAYQIEDIKIQGQFNDDGSISYYVNSVYVVEGYNYKISGYFFYTSNHCFYFGKYGNTLGDSFYIEPVFNDVNPFEEDVNPFD